MDNNTFLSDSTVTRVKSIRLLFFAGFIIPFIPWLIAIAIAFIIPAAAMTGRKQYQEETTLESREVKFWGALCMFTTCIYCIVVACYIQSQGVGY